MNDRLAAKLETARTILRDTQGCAVAFSGGVDSSVVLSIAWEQLAHRCLAVIAASPTYVERERRAALAWLQERGIPYRIIHSDELDLPAFRENRPDRCYHCKKALFTQIAQVARKHGLHFVADGTHVDDMSDYRPGRRAAQELGVLSPLRQAGMTKADLRAVARQVYHLSVADKPAMACLASRFPYGSSIDADKLRQVAGVEEFLEEHGFRVYRARHHGSVVRIELAVDEIPRLLEPALRAAVVENAREQGFSYVTLDLEGYRTGSMNATLTRDQLLSIDPAAQAQAAPP